MAKNIEYADFVDKFTAKKTTDDCYTPNNVYAAILYWVANEYNIDPDKTLRPFFPGGDYQREQYPSDHVVVDNPPFSILSQIVRWYDERGVKYFLFAPGLTLLSTASGTCNYVVTGTEITYANGANVPTGFVTNLGETKVHVAGDLADIIRTENRKNIGVVELPKYDYPDNVITSHKMNRIARQGICLRFNGPTQFIRKLDSQGKKAIYGGGFLIDDRAAADKIEADRLADKIEADRRNTTNWELSQRELDIIQSLNKEVK